jgi:hypothetical protein
MSPTVNHHPPLRATFDRLVPHGAPHQDAYVGGGSGTISAVVARADNASMDRTLARTCEAGRASGSHHVSDTSKGTQPCHQPIHP